MEKAVQDTAAKAFGSFDLKELRRLADEKNVTQYTDECSRIITKLVGQVTSDTGECAIGLEVTDTSDFIRCITAELEARGFTVKLTADFGATYRTLRISW